MRETRGFINFLIPCNDMIQKLNKIAYLLLLLVFLSPSIVKLEHHHKRFICNAKDNNHLHEYHENCAVCNFEFSVFSNDEFHFEQPKEIAHADYLNTYKTAKYTNSSSLSFLLRAPPYKLI